MNKSAPSRLLLAVSLAGLCHAASATDGLDRAKQRGKLVAGVHYVVPEYKAGTKFRTPEAIDMALLENLAQRLRLPLVTQHVELDKLSAGNKNAPDITLAAIPDSFKADGRITIIPTGYVAAPMAIMRTDTDIKRWEQLKGRRVCVAEGGLYVGALAAKYGAKEMIYKAPADALVAVRTGVCDATVHDSALLEELIKLPEWKKFSARLPTGARMPLSFVVPAGDKKTATFLQQVTAAWSASGEPAQILKTAVRNMAFEAYLDQAVPDCH